MLDIDNINDIKLEYFIRMLNEFHCNRNRIRSININNIQRSVVLLKRWNKNNTLNIVPDLENNGDLEEIINNLENPDYDFDDDYLNSLGSTFIKLYGFNVFYHMFDGNISKFLEFIKNTCQKKIIKKLKNVISEEEFNLGFEIYQLENTIQHKLYNYFINDPGIDNLPFEINDDLISEKKLNYYRTIKSNDEFLQKLSYIGLNSNLTFDHNSPIIKYYNLSDEIKEQSLTIRNQIKNAFSLIDQKINIYLDYILERNKLLNKLDYIGD